MAYDFIIRFGRFCRHFDREIIILCVRWYLRFKLSFRDLVEMMAERGISVNHTLDPALCSGIRKALERRAATDPVGEFPTELLGPAANGFTVEFFRTRPIDKAHATLDRFSVVADNLNAATVKAKSLFATLDMPREPGGLRILDQVKRELFVWVPGDHDA
jgi:hypothetical protein